MKMLSGMFSFAIEEKAFLEEESFWKLQMTIKQIFKVAKRCAPFERHSVCINWFG